MRWSGIAAAGALFRICDPKIGGRYRHAVQAAENQPVRRAGRLSGQRASRSAGGLPDPFQADAASGDGLRPGEGGDNLALWDFHDLPVHTHSTEGRQANPLGGPLSPCRRDTAAAGGARPMAGQANRSGRVLAAPSQADSAVAKLLHERHSTRDFDDRTNHARRTCTVLDSTARIQSKWKSELIFGDDGPRDRIRREALSSEAALTRLSSIWPSQLRGTGTRLLHYDADRHRAGADRRADPRTRRDVDISRIRDGRARPPRSLITIAARFGRVAWKYSSIAYALVLKDVGVLIQTFYLMADRSMGSWLRDRSKQIDLFEKITGVEFHVRARSVNSPSSRQGSGSRRRAERARRAH